MAQRFSQQCPFDDKAEQIRQNTLAVCAVNAYFQLMDIPTALAESDSWNAMMQMMANVADIKVPNVGTFSCRVVMPDATVCHIPPEDWHDRAGYVAVAVDQASQQATLIGFMAQSPTQALVSLERFEPMEALLDRVQALQSAAVEVRQSAEVGDRVRTALTQLSDWVDGVIANSWQAVDALINPTQMNFAFRGASAATPANDISRAKLVDLGIQLGNGQPEQLVQVALVMHLTHSDEQRSDIILQVRPLGESPYLTEGVTLTVLDEADNVFMNATSRAIDNYIQLQLSGQSGEQFSVQITLGDHTFREQFVI